MCTVKVQFVLWVAMETVKPHMTKMGVFLRTFFLIKLAQMTNLASIVLGGRGGGGGVQATGLLARLCRYSSCYTDSPY